MVAVATLYLMLVLPQSTLRLPQSTLSACSCKPCHCQGDCHCAGGLCSCSGCGLAKPKRTARPDGLGHCSPACTCGCNLGLPCSCGAGTVQRTTAAAPVYQSQPAYRFPAPVSAPVRRGGC